MTKEELAQKYAEEKAAEFATALKEAYLKGYEQGELHMATTIRVGNLTYVDLGLPSGTLWAVPESKTSRSDWNYHYYDMYTFAEACKLNIPTEEQVEELYQHTKRLYENYVLTFIGVTGERMEFEIENQEYTNRFGYKHTHKYQGEGLTGCYNAIWIKSDIVDGEAKSVRIVAHYSQSVEPHFAGYKLPLFLVKTREELEKENEK